MIKKILNWLGFNTDPEIAPECLGNLIPYTTAAERDCLNCQFEADCIYITHYGDEHVEDK